MSVEDIQKVNKLSQELLDQGIADSREDAVKQAQQILNKEIVDKQEISEDGNIVVKDDLEYYKNIITRTKEYTLQQLNKFKKEIETLTTEVHRLKAELSALKPGEGKSVQEPVEQKKDVQNPLKTEKKEPHPKQGRFTSADVAVEKMFYYGKK